jgi:dGTPase
MVSDLAAETGRRIERHRPQSADDIRRLGTAVVGFSEAMRADEKPLRAFLWENMYRHYKVNRMISRAKRVVTDLFGAFLADPSVLPSNWRKVCGAAGDRATARIVCDYIAGMTDAYALEEHRKLFGAQFS